jgi:hypothetical protein
MLRLALAGIVLVSVASGLLAASAAAKGGNVICTSVLKHVTVTGNVTVPPGKTCWIIKSAVKGNVRVWRGAGLVIWTSTVGGNVQTNSAAWVNIAESSRIHGNLQVHGTTRMTPAKVAWARAPAEPNDLCSTIIDGNVQIRANGPHAPFAIGAGPDCADSLTIGGSLLVQNNLGRVDIGGGISHHNTVHGSILVQGNSAGGTLTSNDAGGDCILDADPQVFVGSTNTAGPGRQNTCNTDGGVVPGSEVGQPGAGAP